MGDLGSLRGLGVFGGIRDFGGDEDFGGFGGFWGGFGVWGEVWVWGAGVEGFGGSVVSRFGTWEVWEVYEVWVWKMPTFDGSPKSAPISKNILIFNKSRKTKRAP